MGTAEHTAEHTADHPTLDPAVDSAEHTAIHAPVHAAFGSAVGPGRGWLTLPSTVYFDRRGGELQFLAPVATVSDIALVRDGPPDRTHRTNGTYTSHASYLS